MKSYSLISVIALSILLLALVPALAAPIRISGFTDNSTSRKPLSSMTEVKSNLITLANPHSETVNEFLGAYSGGVGGVWGGGVHDNDISLTVDSEGNITGNCGNIHDSNGNSLAGSITGSVSSSGAATMSTDASDSITFTGSFFWDSADNELAASGGFTDQLGDTGTWSAYNQTLSSFNLFDANYDYSHVDLSDANLNSLSSSDYSNLLTDTQYCSTAVADGATKILLEYIAPTTGVVDFEETQGYPGDLLEAVNGGSASAVPTQLINGQWVAFALYKTPEALPTVNAGVFNPVQFQASFQPPGFAPGPNFTYPLDLYSPPVILIHGFASGPLTWFTPTATGPLIDLQADNLKVSVVDYSATSLNSFESNQFVLLDNPGGIQQTINRYHSYGIAITKVDVVAHSMGGILTRELSMWPLYKNLENFKSGYVRRLITLGTPHLGSKGANYVVNVISGSAGSLAITALQKLGWNYGAAFGDLEYNSPAIHNITNINPIPSYAVAGISNFPPSESMLFGLYAGLSVFNWVANRGVPITPGAVFPGEESDLIVGASSAAGGLSSSYVYDTLNSTDHIQEPGSGEIGSVVTNLLTGPLTAFDTQGFPPPSSVTLIGSDALPHTPPVNHVTPLSSAFLSITAPSNGQQFQPGATITVTLTPNVGTTLAAASITLGSSGNIVSSQLITGAPFTTTFTIPTNYVGDLPINVSASDTSGNICLVSGDCTVQTTASVTAFTVNPPSLYFSTQNATSQLQVTGSFSDNISRDITAATGTTYVSGDTTVATVNARGLITVVGDGSTQISVSNNGVSSTVAITVSIDPPKVLNVSPSNGAVGTTVPISLVGYGLAGATNAQLCINGAPDVNASISGFVVDSSGSSATGTVTISPGETPGVRTVVVTTPAGVSDTYAPPDAAGFNILTPSPTTSFSVSAPSTATAGTAISVTVTALNAAGATATTYTGTVQITASDGAANLPANAALTNGVGTFSVTLNTAGSQTVTATDTTTSSITGTSGAITVSNVIFYEGDPLNAGKVTLADWVKVGRYAAGLDPQPTGLAYQEADCAPRSTLGSGKPINLADWVQTGRYAAGLDPLTPVGGPTAVSSSVRRMK